MMPDALTGGFADAPVDAARAFRVALDVLARPGRIARMHGAMQPAPLSTAAGTLLLTLADFTTPVHLAPSHDTPQVRAWLTFHCGVDFVAASEAVFAVGTWDALHPIGRFAIGTPEYPDRAATLIVECPDLTHPTARLTGPGLAGQATLALPSIEPFRANHALYPLGFDTYLTARDQVAGLPRSTSVEAL